MTLIAVGIINGKPRRGGPNVQGGERLGESGIGYALKVGLAHRNRE